MNKNVVILRGVSGSGKTSVAENLLKMNAVVCTADDFFYNDEGEYNFDPTQLKDAHAYCRDAFDLAIAEEVETVVVANTNTSDWEWEHYEKKAKDNGYHVYFLVIENRHGNGDLHGVPEEVKETQRSRLLESFKP